jgi:hypothetical protein
VVEGVERRLAAILAADVVGYSRLMEADEAGTHARLKALRKEYIEPRIAEHHGRVVKLTGDGALVEFPSVVEAVLCAADVQRIVAERNADVPPDQRIEFRIGVDLGDVIIEDDDKSTSRRGLKRSPSPAGSVCRAPSTTTSVTRSTSPSRPWASTRSRTSPRPSRYIRCCPVQVEQLRREHRSRPISVGGAWRPSQRRQSLSSQLARRELGTPSGHRDPSH